MKQELLNKVIESRKYLSEKYITTDIIEMLGSETTAISKRVKKSIERLYQTNDISIINRGGTFHFEGSVPNFVRNYLIPFITKKTNLTYLYDNLYF
jgi:hypothetical protein